jgi:hypothetical protein
VVSLGAGGIGLDGGLCGSGDGLGVFCGAGGASFGVCMCWSVVVIVRPLPQQLVTTV